MDKATDRVKAVETQLHRFVTEGFSIVQDIIAAAQATERERLRPWLQHDPSCQLRRASGKGRQCTCGLAKAMRGE